jgi:class 3 adenylate cyclase
MSTKYPYELLENVEQLSSYQGWSADVYRDFLRLQRGELDEAGFRDKYHWRNAVVFLDMTGFTSTALHRGELASLLRILDAQKVCIPILHEFDAVLIRCFADDIVGLFEDPHSALGAAFEIHRRIRLFNDSDLSSEHPTECCIGIGYGQVFAIGPNLAQGDEMNKASKLGEDIARARETLITEQAYQALSGRNDVIFEPQEQDDQLFPFYRAWHGRTAETL